MEYMIWLNGEYVARNEAKIPMTDRGFRLGDVVFDTERTFNGKIFRLREHIDRLYRSLQYTRIDPGMTKEEMASITEEVVERNESVREAGDDYMITQIVTRGEGGRVNHPMKANLSVWIDPIDFVRYAPCYDAGGHAIIPKARSYSPEQIDPKIKHYSRLNMVLADIEASDIDPDAFPVLLDSQGNVSESVGANFFIVTDGVLRTSYDTAVLQGVSRMTIIELATQLGIPTSEENLQPYDVYTADEAFLCSTPFSLLPMGRVDQRNLNADVPGPITSQLLAAFSEMVGLDVVDQVKHRAEVLTSRGQ
jgi:branched-chain amino acid aminotransferase